MEEGNRLSVEGYLFGTAEDAEAAREEAQKVEYLEKNMDYRNRENIQTVYCKSIEKRLFRTPVGWEYLRKLQRNLEMENLEMEQDRPKQEQLPPIPLYTVFIHRAGEEKKQAVAPTVKKKDGVKRLLRLSLFLNILLVVAVSAMFYIAMTGEHPNLLNYERTLVDKYAAWEQELKEKESELRERERQLTDN